MNPPQKDSAGVRPPLLYDGLPSGVTCLARVACVLFCALVSAEGPGCRDAGGEPSAAPGPASDPASTPAAPEAGPVYRSVPPSRDGIGKVYLGREIAQVMGHLAAGWLERGSREAQERTDLLMESLAAELGPGDTVADLGAGTGYFTFRLAALVPEGRVLAVDIQPEMLDLLGARGAELDLQNVEPVLAAEDDPKLPAGAVDLVLLVDAYHEFAFPREVMTAVAASLAPGGRVALVEYRAEDPAVAIKPLHKMSEAQAIREMAAVGLTHLRTEDRLPQQHLLFFTPAEAPAEGDPRR